MSEGRYIVQAFENHAWSIIDTVTRRPYVMQIRMASNLMCELSIAEALVSEASERYMIFCSEILYCRFFSATAQGAQDVAQDVLDTLEDSDISNPVELALRLGADLHGVPVRA